MGVHYFKKTKPAFEFYKWLQLITENYMDFYKQFLPNAKQKFCSMDVNASLALMFLNAEEQYTSVIPTFTHMKPAIQNWHDIPDTWQSATTVQFTEHADLKISNFLQTGVFHYTENDFLTDDIIKKTGIKSISLDNQT
jgi:uncharacterized pyridoxamine 5'-phosphate oxidase family protein